MPRLIPPSVIEQIKRKEEESRNDNRIPLHLPDDYCPTPNDKDREQEETSGIYIIDLVGD